MNNSNLERVCGLWLNTGKSGVKYFSGKLRSEDIEKLHGDCRILIFKNEHKANERSPDYFLFAERKDAEPQPEPEAASAVDDEVPF